MAHPVLKPGLDTRRSEAVASLDSDLVRFGESLRRSHEYEGEAKRLSDKLFRTLQKHFKNTEHAVASVHTGGSFEKKTDVIEPDLDLVFLINEYNPASDNEKMLEDILKVLKKNEQHLEILQSSYKITYLCVNFRFVNGISVDLLPAANLEWDALLKKMGEEEKFAFFFRPSCISKQVSLMKENDSFTHSITRIAKFWFKSLYIKGGFTGGSAMMELIAIAAVQKEKKQAYTCASRAFTRVLGMVQNLSNIRLAFSEKQNGDLKRVSRGRMRRNKRSRNVDTLDYVGKREILQRRRFIIDPADFYSDFLENKEEHKIQQLKEFARITFCRLDRILRGKGKELFTLKLFKPLPKNLASEKSLTLPVNYFVSSIDPYEGTIYSKVKVRNDNVIKNDRSRRAVEVIKQNVLNIVYSTAKGNSGITSATDVEAAVSNWITHGIPQVGRNNGSSFTNNGKADVTLQIPFELKTVGEGPGVKRCAIFVRMNWMK